MQKTAWRKQSSVDDLIRAIFSVVLVGAVGFLVWRFYPNFTKQRFGQFDRLLYTGGIPFKVQTVADVEDDAFARVVAPQD